MSDTPESPLAAGSSNPNLPNEPRPAIVQLDAILPNEPSKCLEQKERPVNHDDAAGLPNDVYYVVLSNKLRA
ncbi:MAG TPA: hypothetical protein VFL57_03400 [Bryobacteraceae bacterium]|nr:hypothetical protein [Bryobacteraceae bacterium]